MRYDPDKHHRQSIRLRGFQYDTAGGYAVTMCTDQKQMLFGGITDGLVVLNEAGKSVQEEWLSVTVRHPSILLDRFVIMPNHIHALIFLATDEQLSTQPSPTLGAVIGAFKSLSSRAVGKHSGGNSCRIWQRNYYEQIIRSEAMLDAFRLYIDNNPAQWQYDAENNPTSM